MSPHDAEGPAPGVPEGSSAPGPTRTSVDPLRRLAPGALLAGRYRILGFVGIGGMGMVYRAHDRELGCEVAVKVLRPELARGELVTRFRRELVLGRQVTHRNVVRIHDIGQDGDLYFLTMDFVSGRSLRDLLEEGRFEPERAVAVASQLAAALGAAHEGGVVHRDLKPANVLIDDLGRAYVTDFGVARSVSTSGLTRTGAVVGTLDYLSPEQARGEAVDARSDLYALGIILFEMLTGELPFPDGSYAETLAQRISGRPRDLSELGIELPARLRAVVRRLLESSPARRYQRASEVLDDLAAVGRPDRSLPRWLPRAAAAAGLVVLAVAGWLVWRSPGREAVGPPDRAVRAAPLARHRIAVLPLADETGRSDLAWMASGLPEMLAEALAETPVLRVVDPARLFRTLDDLKLPSGARSAWSDAALSQVAELFDADRLLVGRVRALGERVRVDLRMVAVAAPGELAPLSLAPSEAALSDLPALLEGMDRAVLDGLEVPASEPPPGAISASPEALRAYSQGTAALRRGDAVAAAPALEAAVAEDAGFAAAWLRLSDAYQALGYLDRALVSAERAVALLSPGRGRISWEARAQQALLAGDPGAALEILAQLRERFPFEVESAVVLAEAYAQEGRLAEARATLEQVAAIDPNHPRVHYLLAKYAVLAGDARKAADDHLVKALVIQNRLKNEQGKADVLNAYGVAYRELGDLAQAEANYRQAAEIRERIGDQRGYATTLRNLALIHTLKGEWEGAEEQLARAMAILEEIGDRAGIAALVNDLGVLEEERGDYAAALEHYRRGLQLRREVGDQRGVAESLNNVGYAYYLLGEYDHGGVYWQQALDLYRTAGNSEGEVLATQSIGLLQLARGEWDAAARSFLEALEGSRAIGLDQAAAVSLGNLGRLAQFQGRYPAALDSFAEALAILGRLEDPRGLTEFTLAEAEALIELGLLEQAGAALDRAATWLEASGNREQLAELGRLRGQWHLAHGDRGAAAAAFAAARRDAEASHGVLAILGARLGSAEQRLAAGRPADAAAELRAVAAEARRLGHALLTLRAGEALARASLARGDPGAADSALREALRARPGCDGYGGCYRLQLLLGRSLEARGEPAEAQAAYLRAAAALERLRGGLTPEQRTAFDRLEEVTEAMEVSGMEEGAERVGAV